MNESEARVATLDATLQTVAETETRSQALASQVTHLTDDISRISAQAERLRVVRDDVGALDDRLREPRRADGARREHAPGGRRGRARAGNAERRAGDGPRRPGAGSDGLRGNGGCARRTRRRAPGSATPTSECERCGAAWTSWSAPVRPSTRCTATWSA